MIPAINHSHVLPPFVGDSPRHVASGSPYSTTATELLTRLGTTPARCVLLKGLFDYRRALYDLGFCEGFQWLDGSFVEDIEAQEDRPPRDVDVVTFARTPPGMTPAEVEQLAQTHSAVFDPPETKSQFGCDAYLIRLDGNPERLVARAAYYQNLFSHRRSDNVWKGMLLLPLSSDDAAAMTTLNRSLEGGPNAASAGT